MDYSKVVDKLNYELWEITEDISFYHTSSTHIDYIGLHSEWSDIVLWCSEESYAETEEELIKDLRLEVSKLTNKLNLCKFMMIKMEAKND